MTDTGDETLADDGTLAGADAGDDELGLPADPPPGFGQDETDDDVIEVDAD